MHKNQDASVQHRLPTRPASKWSAVTSIAAPGRCRTWSTERGKAAAEETDPSGRTESTGCQPPPGSRPRTAGSERSNYRIAIPEPLAGLTGHAGTIALESSQSVMDITFPVPVSPKMGIMADVSGADRYDLIVIGGGSAGLTAAGFAAQIGAKVLIAAEQARW